MQLTINDPKGGDGWFFGLAETLAGSVGWYGEDCYRGTGSFQFCHPVEGDRLTLDQVASIDAIVEGETTLLWDGDALTYFLESNDGRCWVWGQDPNYYQAEGCTRLNPDGSPWIRRDECSGMDPADPAPLGGRVALTFDDGPSATVTPQIVEILRRHAVPATFFVLGERVADDRTWPILEEIIADPLFEVANHSWSHADMASLPLVDVVDEIEDTTAILDTFDMEPVSFRFPYGSSTCDTADLARDLGYLVAGWHIDTGDWCYAAVGATGTCTPSSYWRVPEAYTNDMAGFTVDQIQRFDGGVVLFHDIHQYTADSLEGIIETLKAQGFVFVGMDDLDAFPRFNADDPMDFPWIGEACDTDNDTCWQIEYGAQCRPTEDPALPSNAGVCTLPCEEGYWCTDRDGTAPLFCANTTEGGICLAYSDAINGFCEDVPGTEALTARSVSSRTTTATVCVPQALKGELR